MILHLDIETLPDGEKLTEGEFSPPGNIKKAETIEKWKQETLPGLVEAEYRERSLKSVKGKILCIGYAFDAAEPQVLHNENEKELMKEFNDLMWVTTKGKTLACQWCGWNIKKFDMEWIWQRVIKYKLEFLLRYMPLKRYNDRIIDLMELFVAPNYYNPTKLDDACKFLGIEGKGDIDGSKVYDYYLKGKVREICDYCKDDVKKVQLLASMMGLGMHT